MKKKNEKIELSANMFLGIKDIQGSFLYRTDNTVLTFIKIFPKNCKLMNKEEQLLHSKKITREFVSELKEFKIYFTNRPVDTAGLTEYQASLLEKTHDNQKSFLINERIKGLNSLSVEGKALESEIYIILKEKNTEYAENDLSKRANEISLKLNNSSYRSEILDEKQIIQLCNSYNNPDNAYMEDQNYIESSMYLNI